MVYILTFFFRVHFNNRYTSDLQYSSKSLTGRVVNKQMLANKFIEKDLYRRRFAWNKLNFYVNYFHQHLPERYPGLLQTYKIEIFAIIVDG